jgi:hypothetical protein
MEAKRNDTIKKIFLIGFMIASVSLILMVWSNGLLDNEQGTPSYYRATIAIDDSMYVTLTAIAHNYELGTGTPERQHEHGNGGEHEESTVVPGYTLTPKPTIDWDAIEQDQ